MWYYINSDRRHRRGRIVSGGAPQRWFFYLRYLWRNAYSISKVLQRTPGGLQPIGYLSKVLLRASKTGSKLKYTFVQHEITHLNWTKQNSNKKCRFGVSYDVSKDELARCNACSDMHTISNVRKTQRKFRDQSVYVPFALSFNGLLCNVFTDWSVMWLFKQVQGWWQCLVTRRRGGQTLLENFFLQIACNCA